MDAWHDVAAGRRPGAGSSSCTPSPQHRVIGRTSSYSAESPISSHSVGWLLLERERTRSDTQHDTSYVGWFVYSRDETVRDIVTYNHVVRFPAAWALGKGGHMLLDRLPSCAVLHDTTTARGAVQMMYTNTVTSNLAEYRALRHQPSPAAALA